MIPHATASGSAATTSRRLPVVAAVTNGRAFSPPPPPPPPPRAGGAGAPPPPPQRGAHRGGRGDAARMASGRAGFAQAPQQKSGDAARLAGKLQAAAGGRREGADFAEHGGRNGAAQPLLHRPQTLAVVAAARDDEPRRSEAIGGKTGSVEIRRLQAPEDRSAVKLRQARKQSGSEGGGNGAILLIRSRPHDLVHRADRQPAPGQAHVDPRPRHPPHPPPFPAP